MRRAVTSSGVDKGGSERGDGDTPPLRIDALVALERNHVPHPELRV